MQLDEIDFIACFYLGEADHRIRGEPRPFDENPLQPHQLLRVTGSSFFGLLTSERRNEQK